MLFAYFVIIPFSLAFFTSLTSESMDVAYNLQRLECRKENIEDKIIVFPNALFVTKYYNCDI